MDCTGDENNIFFECDHQPVGTSNCGHDQDAGVVCVPGMDFIHCISKFDTEGRVQQLFLLNDNNVSS